MNIKKNNIEANYIVNMILNIIQMTVSILKLSITPNIKNNYIQKKKIRKLFIYRK